MVRKTETKPDTKRPEIIEPIPGTETTEIMRQIKVIREPETMRPEPDMKRPEIMRLFFAGQSRSRSAGKLTPGTGSATTGPRPDTTPAQIDKWQLFTL